MIISDQQQLLRNQYQHLHDALAHARETCAIPELRDWLREQQESVDDLITSLNQADITLRTGDFEELIAQMQSANVDLGKLKDDISRISQDVAVFGKVVSGINSVISAAAKLVA